MTVRFLMDENVPAALTRALREAGHDARDLKEELRGRRDAAVLQTAAEDRRVLITRDRDFVALFAKPDAPRAGILLLSYSHVTGGELATLAIQALRKPGILEKLDNHLTILTRTELRVHERA